MSLQVLAHPSTDTIDRELIQQLGGEFAYYIDSDSSAPFMSALRGVLELPVHESQILNVGLALSNVVALLGMTLAEGEAGAAALVRGQIADTAFQSFPELLAVNPLAKQNAEALICRVFGQSEGMPEVVDGPSLALISAYGDTAIMLIDELGLPRPIVAAAVGQAAREM